MRMTVLGSGSAGNGYLLEGTTSALVIECGVKPEELFRRTSIAPSKIAGCLVSHEHGDHAAYAGRYASLGLHIYASEGTIRGIKGIVPEYQASVLRAMHVQYIGEWKVSPFDVRHDAAEPLGFIIEHPEAGRILFVTDTRMVPYTFRSLNLDHIMVEANYDDRIMDGRVESGEVDQAQAARVRGTHMSLGAACDLIRANQTANLKTVTIIHLSSGNADARRFREFATKAALFAKIEVASAGLVVEMNKREI